MNGKCLFRKAEKMKPSSNILRKLSLVCLSAVFLFSCGSVQQPAPIPASNPPSPSKADIQIEKNTQIVIDGLADDWNSYPIIGNDPAGDQVAGSPDIGEVRAFDNDKFFYLLIRLHEDGKTDHYDILLDVNGGNYDYQASVWPEKNQFVFANFPVTGGMQPLKGGSAAKKDVIEVKLPLSILNGQPVLKVLVQTFLGDRTGDKISDLPVILTNETEVIGVAPAVQQASPVGQPASPESNLCQGESAPPSPHFNLVLPGSQAEMLWQTQFVPWWVRTGPDGRVYAVSDGGDSIYELKPDGSLVTAFRCPGVQIETGIMASDRAFWFATRDGGRLYRVDPAGTVKIIAQSGNRNLEAGLNGSVYALENGLVRIDPDGKQTVITNALNERKFAIGPKGEIVALDKGKVVRVSETGEMTELASGYGPEPWLTFGPDGLLYVTHWTGVDSINLENNSVKPITWLKNSNIGEAGTFTPDGRLLLYHPNTDVFAVDLKAKTVKMYYQVTSNSWAMAASPDGKIYFAFGDGQLKGKTTIYRVVDRQTLEPILAVPYGLEQSMVFDGQGRGYLGVADSKSGSMIYAFDPASKTFNEVVTPDCRPQTMAVNPQDGRLWWGDCDRFASLDKSGKKVILKGIQGSENSSLAITSDGEFYTLVFFHRDNPDISYVHHIYHLDMKNSTWADIADITQSDPGITMAKLVGCAGGKVYTIESLGPENLPVSRSSYNAVRRLEADGSLTLVGYDFSFDGQAVSCDYSGGRVIFTSGAGIIAVTMPK
jgi:streptogramin lyase